MSGPPTRLSPPLRSHERAVVVLFICDETYASYNRKSGISVFFVHEQQGSQRVRRRETRWWRLQIGGEHKMLCLGVYIHGLARVWGLRRGANALTPVLGEEEGFTWRQTLKGRWCQGRGHSRLNRDGTYNSLHIRLGGEKGCLHGGEKLKAEGYRWRQVKDG